MRALIITKDSIQNVKCILRNCTERDKFGLKLFTAASVRRKQLRFGSGQKKNTQGLKQHQCHRPFFSNLYFLITVLIKNDTSV